MSKYSKAFISISNQCEIQLTFHWGRGGGKEGPIFMRKMKQFTPVDYYLSKSVVDYLVDLIYSFLGMLFCRCIVFQFQ